MTEREREREREREMFVLFSKFVCQNRRAVDLALWLILDQNYFLMIALLVLHVRSLFLPFLTMAGAAIVSYKITAFNSVLLSGCCREKVFVYRKAIFSRL